MSGFFAAVASGALPPCLETFPALSPGVVIGQSSRDGTLRASVEHVPCVVDGDLYGPGVSSAEDRLLDSLRRYGERYPEALRGEFACVVWDPATNSLRAARDRFGVKPLFYGRLGSTVILASEMRTLFSLGLSCTWDSTSVAHAVAHQYLPPGRTLFAGIRSLPPGHSLTIRSGSEPIEQRYWDLSFPNADANRRGCTTEELRAALSDAVRIRADGPLAVHLSGGLDSSSILALAMRHQRSVTSYGIAFEQAPYDEHRVAARIARELGADHHVISVGADDLIDSFEEAVATAGTLAINGQLPAKYLLAKEIGRRGHIATLTGEGADETFLGYAHLRWDLLAALAAGGDEHAAEGLRRLTAQSGAQAGVMLPSGEAPSLDSLRSVLGFAPSFLRAKASFGRTLRGLLSPAFQSPADPFAELVDALVTPEVMEWAPVHRSAYLWIKLALAGYILGTLGDAVERVHGLNGRTPFLDHLLAERVSSLPVGECLDIDREKIALREVVRGIAPEEARVRPKQPFLAPPLTRYATSRGWAQIRDTLGSASFRENPIFDQPLVLSWLNALERKDDAAKQAADPALSMLLSVAFIQRRLRPGDIH